MAKQTRATAALFSSGQPFTVLTSDYAPAIGLQAAEAERRFA